MHRASDGWILARAPASPAQGLHHHGPRGATKFPPKLLRHSASAQARRHSQQPSAGEPLFSPADHRRTSGSDAGSVASPSGLEGAPRDPPATELAPDMVALIKRSVDQAAKNAFEAGLHFTQVFMPVLLAAMSLLRVERANGPFHECGNDGVPDCWPVVKSQIDDVFGLKIKSAQRTACGRRFASQVWEKSYAFTFGAGRPASFLLEKNPGDIVPDDAIRAFTPYLYRTKDEVKQGDEDCASYRDFEAGSSAAAESDRDEAKELSSSASMDIGRPLSDPRGGNAADESVDGADDCPDDDDNVSGVGKGLTRSGWPNCSFTASGWCSKW